MFLGASGQELHGLYLGPACSLNPNFLPQQGPERQTERFQPCACFFWAPEQWGWGWASTPRAPASRDATTALGLSCQWPWLSASSGRRLQAGPGSAAQMEETSTGHPAHCHPAAQGGQPAGDMGFQPRALVGCWHASNGATEQPDSCPGSHPRPEGMLCFCDCRVRGGELQN